MNKYLPLDKNIIKGMAEYKGINYYILNNDKGLLSLSFKDGSCVFRVKIDNQSIANIKMFKNFKSIKNLNSYDEFKAKMRNLMIAA